MLDPAAEFGNFTVRNTVVAIVNPQVLPLVSSDPHRISLIVCWNGAGANSGYIKPLTQIVGTQGIQVIESLPPIILTYAEHGGLVQQAWYCACDAVNGVFTVIETMYDPHKQGL